MITTENTCTACGFHLVMVGHDTSRPFCPNQYCSDKFEDACPRCQSEHKNVRLVRTGFTAFTCLDCGQDWDRVNGRAAVPSSSNLVVLQFRKRP